MGIANTIKQRQDKEGMLKRSLERLIQLYTDKSHFVYELLQNAEDAQAHHVKFVQYEDHLEFMHDGVPFTEQNLEGLCDIGKSDKVSNLNQIGEFGVGFKSVFGICETVRLYSSPGDRYADKKYQPFEVEIRDFTNPVDIDPIEMSEEYTTKFVFPYQVGKSFSGFTNVDDLNRGLSKRLTGLGFTTLLFMKNLNLIEYEIKIRGQEKNGKYQLKKRDLDYGCTMITAVDEEEDERKGKNKEELFFLKFSKEIDSSASNQTIDIAFSATVDQNGKIKFKKSENPYISVYFPTETESKLDFIIQGPFRTTPNRSSVPSDDQDNMRMADLAGDLLVDSVVKLMRMGHMSADLLNILPIQKDRFDIYPLFKPLYTKLLKAFKTYELLPTNQEGVFVNAGHALIARNNALMELLPSKTMSDLIHDDRKYEWMPEEIKETGQYAGVHSYLMKDLKVPSLRPEDLKNYFVANRFFLASRTRSWLAQLYKLYNTIPNVFSKTNRSNLLEIPIVLTKDDRIVAPYQKVDGEYKPNVFLPVTSYDMSGMNFVDPIVYSQCEDFFKYTLQLTPPDEYSYFVKNLEKRYGGKYVSVGIKENVQDIRQIQKYLRDDSKRKNIMEHIHKNFCLRCFKRGQSIWISPFENEVMFPVDRAGNKIEEYFKGVNESIYYVDYSAYKNESITYDELSALGVTDKIFEDDDVIEGAHELGRGSLYSYTWNTKDSEFRWKLSLKNVESVLKYISNHPDDATSMLKSQLIFKVLMQNEDRLSGEITILKDSEIYRRDKEVATIIKILTRELKNQTLSTWNGKWLYDNNHQLVSQSEISKHDLNRMMYGAIDKNSNLYDLLKFYKNEDDLYEEAQKEYDQLSEEKRKSFFEIELQRRFGMSVDDLEDQIGNKPRQSKQQSVLSDFEFPVQNVKDWSALKKHAAQSLFYADAVTYEVVQRSIRVSKSDDGRSYLLNMYRINYSNKAACQICHKPTNNVYATQIEDSPDLELDQLYLCLCPNCSQDFRKIRNNKNQIMLFLDRITALTEGDIEKNDYVEVPLEDKKVWFTQTHVAEIAELLRLKNQVDDTVNKNGTVYASQLAKSTTDKSQRTYKVDAPIVKKSPKEQAIETSNRNRTRKSVVTTVPPQTPQIKVQEGRNVALNGRDSQNVKSMRLIKQFGERLIGKTVYFTPEHSYATVTKYDGVTISFSIADLEGRKKQINYYVADCMKFDLVYEF